MLTVRQAFQIGFGRMPSADEERRLAGCAAAADQAGTLRAVIAAFDRQTHPTPLTVRFTAGDIETVDLGRFKLVLDRHDISVSSQVLASKDYEPHVRGFVERTLRPGMTVIDIGANVGFYTMLCASIVGREGRVVAFEPNSENCRLILLSTAANGFANVELHALALSNAAGTAFFTPAIGSNGALLPGVPETVVHPNCTVVATARLDAIVKERVDLIKADVEGAEYLALSGGRGLIERHRPTIVTEFSLEMLPRVSGISGADFLRWMSSLGYRAHLLERAGTRMVEIIDIDRLVSSWGDLGRIEDIAFLPG